MKRLEAMSIAGVLGVGSIVGFAGARWGQQEAVEKGALAQRIELSAVPTGPRPTTEAPPPMTLSEPLEAILLDLRRSRRLVALDRFCDGLDAEAVHAAVASMPGDNAPQSRELRERLMSRWAMLDPAGAAAFAAGLKDASVRTQMMGAVQDKGLPEAILHDFTVRLAQDDFEDALKFADAIPASERQNVIWAAFYTASEKDPFAAVARALTMPAGRLRASAVEAATAVWLEKNPPAAMAWVLQRPDTPITYDRTLLVESVTRWSSSDPAAAARFVQSFPAGKQREDFLPSVASTWAYHRGIGPALEWVQGLPEDKAKAEALSRVVSQWSYTDPPAAAAFAAGLPAGGRTGAMLENIGRQWAQVDPEGALLWAAAQPDAALEKNLAPSALGALAADDPARAVPGLAALRTPEARAAAITAMAKSWADSDPQEAARWVLELPEADASRAALQEAISAGTARDPAAMAQWLESMKGHPRRDVAVEAFARGAMDYDPAAAAAWANTLADAETRLPLVKNIVRQMANFDPPAAREWVLGQSFEAAERKALLDQISQAEKRK